MVSPDPVVRSDDNRRRSNPVFCFVPRMDRSGAPISALLLMRALRSSRSVQVLSVARGALTPCYEKSGIPIACVGSTHWYHWRWRGAVRSLFRAGTPGVLHINNLCKEGVVLARAARRRHMPVLWHIREDPRSTRARNLRSRILALSTRILTVSEEIRGNLFPDQPPSKVAVIHNGVEPGGWTKSASVGRLRRFRGWGPGCLVIGLLGRLVPRKGVREFVLAARALARQNPSVRFLLMGRWDERGRDNQRFNHAMAEVLRDPALSSKLYCTGEIEDSRTALDECDIVALPSWWEGSSRTLLEAMTLGRPLVTTSAGGNPEIVEEGVSGLLIPARSTEALLEALAVLTSNAELRHKLGAGARRRVETHFSLDRHCASMERHYDAIGS